MVAAVGCLFSSGRAFGGVEDSGQGEASSRSTGSAQVEHEVVAVVGADIEVDKGVGRVCELIPSTHPEQQGFMTVEWQDVPVARLFFRRARCGLDRWL